MPPSGLGKRTNYYANANRGLEHMFQLFDKLAKKVSRKLGIIHSQLGDLVAIDGSLIDATLSPQFRPNQGINDVGRLYFRD